MSYDSTDGTYHSAWTQQNYGKSSEAYTQGASGYSGRGRHTYPQPGIDTSYYQYPHGGDGSPQYSYSEQGAPRAPYVQSTTTASSAYTVLSPTNGYAGGHQPSQYDSATLQYSQQPQVWPHTQPSPVVPGSQGMMQPHFVTSPVGYGNPQLPLVAPRTNVDAGSGYGSPNAWSNGVSSALGSSTGHQTTTGRSTESSAEYVVPCPYNCGTVLTGVHAVGNMTRHLKSQNCVASGKDKTRYACPVQGCDKRYIRSDGLKVHLRKRHNISQTPDRNGSSECEENEYEYS
ncbi:hypothetical protein BU25DRAFT_481122 [Macroventuria anomochaeta]|uniref:Uncharacterized protein n=1 Tax=Macroventuria anomochaeta TaxID=301207 RepID=A0ACB6RL69_9PLEO|nr:uncharacterized protein BU25DRAFT_481122 [Macroventuria anomochaeta]KAF2622062.1 hypothetical protein BU25DRAFT_481122 [Macroventuria anomochaeta]